LNPASGGTAEAVRNLVLHSGDARQAVLTLDAPSEPWIRSFASEVYCAGPGKGKYGYTPQLPKWLQTNLHKYDAAVVHGCWQFHGIAASVLCRRAEIPFFAFPHGMLDPYFNQVSRAKHLKKLAYWPLERSVLEKARSVFFTSAEECERAHRSFRFDSQDEIVPLGISAPLQDPAVGREELLSRFPQLANKRVLLYLGRLHPKKGVDLLIRAFSKVAQPAFHLLIVGPPGTEAVFQELTRMAAPVSKQVTFTGMLTGTVKAGAIAAAEALVLPSHQENFGFSAVEALAFGCPVLLSDRVNIWREIVTDGAGIVASDTESGTASLLQKWFALAPAEIKQMSAAAHNCFKSRFRAETACRKFLAAIRKCGINSNDRSSSSLQLLHA
jgi:glycosyltransferase involved in cell wall biosynthesis